MRSVAGIGVCVVLGLASATAQPTPVATAAPSKAWIAASDAYTQQLLAVQLKHHPEGGSAEGLAQFDEQVSKPTLADFQAERSETEAVLAKLKAAAGTEQDKNVREDLEILQKAIDLQIRTEDYDEQHDIDFNNASEQVFGGLKTLLDDQVAAGRRDAAVVRLRKYAGVEPGFTPLTEILKQRETEKMAKPDMLYPSRGEIETELGRNQSYIEGIPALFAQYKLTGWEEPYAKLKVQLTNYDAWVPRASCPRRVLTSGCHRRSMRCRLKPMASTFRRVRLRVWRMRRLRNTRARWPCWRRRSRRRMDGHRAITAT